MEVFTVHCQGCDVMYEQCAKYKSFNFIKRGFSFKRIYLLIDTIELNLKGF